MTVKLFGYSNGEAAFRAAGRTREEVEADLAVMAQVLPPGKQMLYLGPVSWGHEFVVHGEIRDAISSRSQGNETTPRQLP